MKAISPLKTVLIVLLVSVLFLSGCVVQRPSPIQLPTGSLQVHFIDVGQGDSILILSPGGRAVLIDGGEARSGALDYLKNLGVRKLDLVFATHPHDDHIGGLPEIFKAIPVSKVVTNGQAHTTTGYERFLDAIVEARAEYIEVSRGDLIENDGLTFEILHPAGDTGDNLNENSVVLRLVYGKISFIFTGDAEKGAEASILASKRFISATILKLGHHGSRTSTSPPFLAQVKPAVAIYSAGAGNKYGHPHIETLEALEAAGVEVYGTDRYGTIVVSTDGSTYQVAGGQPRQVAEQTEETLYLDKLSVTSPVSPGAMATLSARTLPGAEAKITVYVKSGASQAQGLEPQKAGKDGIVTWSWRVGSSTTDGAYRIEVTASKHGQTITREINYTVRK